MGGQSSFDHVQAESESHHQYDTPGFHLEFFLDSTCTWSKDDGPPQMIDQDLT